MTAAEFALLAATLQTAYPWAQLFPGSQAMDLWYRHLQDIPADLAQATVERWIETNSKPPTIADIRAGADHIVNSQPQAWHDAWDKVRRAISRYGYMRGRDALEGMDVCTRQMVQQLGWQQLCLSDNADAVRANFRMCYNTNEKREREKRLVSSATRAHIAEIQGTVPDCAEPLLDRFNETL